MSSIANPTSAAGKSATARHTAPSASFMPFAGIVVPAHDAAWRGAEIRGDFSEQAAAPTEKV